MIGVPLGKCTITLSAMMLLIIGAACTREKPPLTEPTPTLVVQRITPAFPSSGTALPTVPITLTQQTAVPSESAEPTITAIPTQSSGPTATIAPSVPGGSTTYTIQWGDWLSKIADRFGVTNQAILTANPGLDPNRIIPGQVIVIPSASGTVSPSSPSSTTPVPPKSGATTYTVQRGDWFYGIARKFGVSAEALRAANPGVSSDVVHPGQVLNIPGGGQPAATPVPSKGPGATYTVKQGDTLFSIAVKFGKTAYEIQIANHLPSENSIYPGQTLIIP